MTYAYDENKDRWPVLRTHPHNRDEDHSRFATFDDFMHHLETWRNESYWDPADKENSGHDVMNLRLKGKNPMHPDDIPYHSPYWFRSHWNHRSNFIAAREKCPAWETLYENSWMYWETAEGKPQFYKFLFSFNEEFDGNKCAVSNLIPDTIQTPPKLQNQVYSEILSRNTDVIWDFDEQKEMVHGVLESKVSIFSMPPSDAKGQIVAMRWFRSKYDEHLKKNPKMWGKEGVDSFLTGKFFLVADRNDGIFHYLLEHLYLVAGATVGACIIFLHPLYGLAVGIFLAIINFQIIGLVAIVGMKLDIVAFAVFVMAIGFEIEYVIHIAHAFLYCKGHGLERTKNALEAMGLTVFSAFLSTAVQQLVLLFFATSLMFEIYPILMLIVLTKAGLSGFIFVPVVLGLINQLLGSPNKQSRITTPDPSATKSEQSDEKPADPAANKNNGDEEKAGQDV